MASGLRFGLLLASLIALGCVLFFVINKRLNIKYSIIWILWGLLSLTMAVFPETYYTLTGLLGIEIPVNGVFLMMIGLLYVLTFYVYLMISKHNDEIIKLTYELVSCKKEIDELKKNEK